MRRPENPAARAVNELEPPSFTFSVNDIRTVDNFKAVTIEVHNRGGRPVADLRVRAHRGENESREVIVDYVPANSARLVTFIFDDADTASQLSFVVDSFTHP